MLYYRDTIKVAKKGCNAHDEEQGAEGAALAYARVALALTWRGDTVIHFEGGFVVEVRDDGEIVRGKA